MRLSRASGGDRRSDQAIANDSLISRQSAAREAGMSDRQLLGTLAHNELQMHNRLMSEEPSTYIIAALSSVGITCQALDISSYDPMVFGNLVAKAETSIGSLSIVYDRGFYVEAQQTGTDIMQIVKALEQHKKAAHA
jgi:hypothetical protein